MCIASCSHPDCKLATGADLRCGDVLIIAETWNWAVRCSCRTSPARGSSEIRKKRGVCALPKSKGDRHLLFADGLVK